ncbi:MAG TPA: TIGR03086 family metal-binding protein [Acidimicrobiales bacterium]|nr:TIGR03086 family metal-binding protein [Acidimicrobiales bacterium]
MRPISGPDELLAHQDQVLRHTAAIVAAVRPDQLGLPTPCAAWTVGDLIAHLADANLMFATAVSGDAGEVAPEGGPPGAAGDGDVVERYHRSVPVLLAAWRRPGAVEGAAALPFATLPAVMALEMQTVDHLVHSWDLARATGLPEAIDPVLAEFAYRSVTAAVGDDARGADGPFGPEVACPPDAPVQDRLVAFLGRRP